MANSPQSKKRARQGETRYAVNKARRSRIRTFLRKVEEAIATGDQSAASEALRMAQPELARGITKGVLHKNTVARKMSRLSSRVKSLTVATARVERKSLIKQGAPQRAPFFFSGACRGTVARAPQPLPDSLTQSVSQQRSSVAKAKRQLLALPSDSHRPGGTWEDRGLPSRGSAAPLPVQELVRKEVCDHPFGLVEEGGFFVGRKLTSAA